MKKLDYYLIGPISLDSEQLLDGPTTKLIGGALPFGSYAALAGGITMGVLTKMAKEDQYIADLLYVKEMTMLDSDETTSFHLRYLSENRELRTLHVNGSSDMFYAKDIPDDIEAKVYHLAGLIYGDFSNNLFPALAEKGQLACDLQGFLRHNVNHELEFQDWPDKLECIPYVTYLKADAAEAEVITGMADRREAAKQLHAWGAKEILITHNSEVLVYDGETFYTCPIRSRNLSGRSGRGDSTFSTYITERIHAGIKDALFYATSLVSLKMETVGPFKGVRSDVEAYQKEVYADLL